MHDEPRLPYLWRQYLSGQATEAELLEFSDWLNGQTDQEVSEAYLAGLFPPAGNADKEDYDRERLAAVLSGIRAEGLDRHPTQAARRIRIHWSRYAVAAAILLVVVGGAYLRWFHQERKTSTVPEVARVKDVAPGKEGAILTLADGSRVALDSIRGRWSATQNGSRAVLDQGRLSYQAVKPAGQTAEEGTINYNTMTTPRGRQFQFRLPDGTKVWLNAASSITFPTAFTGKERRVKIDGEAYLEIAKDANRPFRVDVGGHTTIEVLGTNFNVNAYADEGAIRTTLLEGSVRVVADKRVQLLSPGQQALVDMDGGKDVPGDRTHAIRLLKNVDTAQIMAWKHGTFNFQDKNLEEVMRQLARWYDIEVVYEKNAPDIEFFGEMGRNLNLSQVLEGLKGAGVNFHIEDGRRLVVSP